MKVICELPNEDFMDFETGLNFYLYVSMGEIHWRMINTNIPNPESCAITSKVQDTSSNRKMQSMLIRKFLEFRGYDIIYM